MCACSCWPAEVTGYKNLREKSLLQIEQLEVSAVNTKTQDNKQSKGPSLGTEVVPDPCCLCVFEHQVDSGPDLFIHGDVR